MTRSDILKKRTREGRREELPLMTAKDLLRSGLAGIWKDRTDIRSSCAFARQLRDRLARRGSR